MKAHWQFLKSFLKSPKSMGSVMPSSHQLVDKMLDDLPWKSASTVVELGAGTGAVTEGIVQRLSSRSHFICFEFDDELHAALAQQYPHIHMAHNALELQATLQQHGERAADIIISSLPFANFSDADQTKLITAISASLANHGHFVLYQYTRQLEPLLERHFAQVSHSYVLQNVPPAFVYVCRH